MSIFGNKERGPITQVVVLLIIIALSIQVIAGDKAIGVAGSALQTTSTGGQKWAIIVGINEYSNVPTVDFAHQDAVALMGSLIKAGFPADNIILMTDTAKGAMYPTRGNLRARINHIATIVEKEDVLVMYFSGHGTQNLGQGYLVPIDGSPNDPSSLVSLRWVKTTLETSSAKHRLLILDACHSGAKAGDEADSPAKTMLSNLSGAAFATLSSCDASQLSYENKARGHGVFTAAIIDGLTGTADKMAQGNNDNIVTATELWAYAALKTKQWSVRTGKIQTPVLSGNFKGLIEIVRFKSMEDLKARKEKLSKKLEVMQQLNRTSAADQLRKEIAKLEIQLNRIGGGIGDIAGSDEVHVVYARYNASKKQVDDLRSLLAEKQKIYQPTSRAISMIKSRIVTAESEFKRTLSAKYQADAIMYEALQNQVDAKQSQYDELTKEMLPSAPQAKKIAAAITEIQKKQVPYQLGYFAINPPQFGDVIINSIGIKLVYIPSGRFVMGCPSFEIGKARGSDTPVHKVSISNGFFMGVTEVTQSQYKAVMGKSPSRLNGDNNPVERVSWNDAMEFCRKLSRKDGKTFTLPTEAQWEYACRAGTSTVYSFGSSESSLGDYAWYSSNSGRITHPVGLKKPNAFGLYDMHGNVLEWCLDWYSSSYYSSSPDVNPPGPGKGIYRVLRGGAWHSRASDLRCAQRSRYGPTYTGCECGFRIVMHLTDPLRFYPITSRGDSIVLNDQPKGL